MNHILNKMIKPLIVLESIEDDVVLAVVLLVNDVVPVTDCWNKTRWSFHFLDLNIKHY